jgi:diaminopimelate epimerase
MKLRFSKMQGAGNDFIVLDATSAPLELSTAQYRALADRRFGVGADQILIVGPSTAPDIDFSYRIVNADGGEVEQCGNGARCFVRFVREHGLTDKARIRVSTAGGVIEPEWLADGQVRVDMGAPVFEPSRLPFDNLGLSPRMHNHFELWPLPVNGRSVEIAAVSMGNPHAVQRVDDVDAAPVAEIGPLIEGHTRFARRVNAGFMQVVNRGHIRLRVYERGAGETLACGTGACAAVAAGVRLGWLDAQVRVDTRGGRLDIAWAGLGHRVMMSGPAATVFEGEVDLDALAAA